VYGDTLLESNHNYHPNLADVQGLQILELFAIIHCVLTLFRIYEYDKYRPKSGAPFYFEKDVYKNMNKILISACLLGDLVRYDGQVKPLQDTKIEIWRNEDRLVAFCPEVSGGLPTPRQSAEIIGNGDGKAVLSGSARVMDRTGKDVSAPFMTGANLALELCKKYHIKIAILTDSSPSCGSTQIYNGKFSREKIQGVGVTTALLLMHGIKVFSQHEIHAAARHIST